MASAAHRSATELCQVLLENFFGGIVAKVASALLHYGRLEAAGVARMSEVSPRLTRQSLAVLIQHNMVQYSTTQEGGGERTFYECNWQEVLHLQKIGKIMWWTNQEISPEAAAIVKYVAIYGKVKAGDISSAFTSSEIDEEGSQREFEETLLQLVTTKVLRIVQRFEAIPLEDYKESVRRAEILRLNGQAITEAKKIKDAEVLLDRHMSDLKSIAVDEKAGLKRKSEEGDGRVKKRMKSGAEDDRLIVDPEVMLRINHDKFAVLQRNEDLFRICQRRLGATCAAVYRHVLKMLEPRIFDPAQDTRSMVLSTVAIGRALPRDFDLASVWAKNESTSKRKRNGKKRERHSKRKRRRMNGNASPESGSVDESEDEETEQSDAESFIEQDVNDLASEDEYDPDDDSSRRDSGDRLRLLSQFLHLFAHDSIPFLVKVGDRSYGEWQVDYVLLGDAMRSLEIESLVQSKVGDSALRVLRIVRAKVKVDEKQVATTALLRQKEVRAKLAAMHELGILQLQEIPRRADRLPKENYYLWFYNGERAGSVFSQDLCKAVARVLQRLKFELKKRDRLLAKSQRTDVRNRESEFLSKGELVELRKIRAVEEKLLTQAMRLAETYAVLTEY